MEFECKTIPVLKPILNSEGAVEPLCNSCTQVDCSNPVHKKKVSVFGVNKEWYIYMAGGQMYQVVSCMGYQR